MRDWLRLIICCILGAGIHALIFLPPYLTSKPEAGGKKSEESASAQKMQAKLASQLQQQQQKEQKKQKQKPDQKQETEEKEQQPPVEEQEKEQEQEEVAPQRTSSSEAPDEEGELSGRSTKKEQSEPETQDQPEPEKEETEKQEQQETDTEETAEEGKEDSETENAESASAESQKEQTADTSAEATKEEAEVTGEQAKSDDENATDADETSEAAQSTESNKKKELQKKTDELSKKGKQVIDASLSQTEYKTYMQNMPLAKVQGKATPQLVFAYKDVAEILKVHNYYNMRILALRPGNTSTVVEVRGLGGTIGETDASYQKITDFNWENYSNRVTKRTSPFFNQWKKQIRKQNLLPPDKNQGGSDRLMLVSVTPNQVDAYFRHKQLKNIKRADLKPDKVHATIGRFYKTSFDSWILAIESTQTKDGEFIEIDDFERDKLQKGN